MHVSLHNALHERVIICFGFGEKRRKEQVKRFETRFYDDDDDATQVSSIVSVFHCWLYTLLSTLRTKLTFTSHWQRDWKETRETEK